MPKIIKVPLPEGSGGGKGFSWARFHDPDSDSRRYEQRWFAEYRAFVRRGYRQRDFYSHYQASMEAL